MKSRSTKRPSEIYILGKKWSIKYVKRLVIEGMPCDGVTYHDTHLIKIRSGLGASAMHATIFHEMIHATLFMSGMNQILKDDQEEALVRALEHGLAEHVSLRCMEDDSDSQA